MTVKPDMYATNRGLPAVRCGFARDGIIGIGLLLRTTICQNNPKINS